MFDDKHCGVGTSHLDHDDPLPRDRPLRFGNMDPELVGLDDDSMTIDSSTDIAGGVALLYSRRIQCMLGAHYHTPNGHACACLQVR